MPASFSSQPWSALHPAVNLAQEVRDRLAPARAPSDAPALLAVQVGSPVELAHRYRRMNVLGQEPLVGNRAPAAQVVVTVDDGDEVAAITAVAIRATHAHDLFLQV